MPFERNINVVHLSQHKHRADNGNKKSEVNRMPGNRIRAVLDQLLLIFALKMSHVAL